VESFANRRASLARYAPFARFASESCADGRGQDEPSADTVVIRAYLPVLESFGFTGQLMSSTGGQAFPQLVFSHFEPVSGDVNDPESKAAQVCARAAAHGGLSLTCVCPVARGGSTQAQGNESRASQRQRLPHQDLIGHAAPAVLRRSEPAGGPPHSAERATTIRSALAGRLWSRTARRGERGCIIHPSPFINSARGDAASAANLQRATTIRG
jgi:hypothetical protein